MGCNEDTQCLVPTGLFHATFFSLSSFACLFMCVYLCMSYLPTIYPLSRSSTATPSYYRSRGNKPMTLYLLHFLTHFLCYHTYDIIHNCYNAYYHVLAFVLFVVPFFSFLLCFFVSFHYLSDTIALFAAR